ncbi:MAG: phosphoglycerate dehydrogenase [Chloroflexi bacterium]|nr:phosphoglycerate dehydrogenase [Chloroflexota bacterium]
MFRILVTEPLAAEGLDVLRQKSTVDLRTDLDRASLLQTIREYEGLIVRSKTPVTEEVIAAAPRLMVIGRAGTGVDNIDLEAATRRGIVVVNAPYGNTVSVAEHTIGMMLALARRIPYADCALRQGRWEKIRCEGVQLRGKVLGLVGLGRIGTAVARRALAMEMQIVGYDPFVTPERAAQAGVRWVTMEELLQVSDFVSLHLPENQQTRRMVGERELALMKPTSVLINCARGGLVDEQALANALQTGRLAGAALDVFENEPPTGSPLLCCDSVVLTPHLAGSTAEAQRDAAVDVARQVLDVLAGRMPEYPVNAPSLSPEELKKLGPYLDLAQRLGSFYAQLAGNHLHRVEVACSGDVARQRMDMVLAAVLVGLLSATAEEPVNWINSQLLAQERGIAFGVRHEPLRNTAGWGNLIEVHLCQDSREHVLAGTILNGEPHIVQIDGYWLDFVARGLVLVSEHIEQPGILGRMGTVLGANGININFVQVGRKERGGPGRMVLGLDDPLTPEVLAQVMSLPSIRSAKMVQL